MSPPGPAPTTAPTPSEPADMRSCKTAEDCVPVWCKCECSGCGGFSYDDVVNKAYEATWHELKGCQQMGACPEVCCAPCRLVCEAGTCVVKRGLKDNRKPPVGDVKGIVRVTYLSESEKREIVRKPKPIKHFADVVSGSSLDTIREDRYVVLG